MRLSKQQSRQRWAELTAIFNDWDVLSVAKTPDGPQDEYSDLVGATMRLLEQNADEHKIAKSCTKSWNIIMA